MVEWGLVGDDIAALLLILYILYAISQPIKYNTIRQDRTGVERRAVPVWLVAAVV